MKHPNTVYRGERIGGCQRAISVRVTVDGRALTLPRAHDTGYGFEWGYGGAGPAQLSLALLLDATGDSLVSVRTSTWFKWAVVCNWGPEWTITAGQIQEWVARFERYAEAGRHEPEGAELATTGAKGGAV